MPVRHIEVTLMVGKGKRSTIVYIVNLQGGKGNDYVIFEDP